MNRKHNPLVALVALLLLAVLLLCAGCSGVAAAEEPESSPRFNVETYANVGSYGTPFNTYVITDTETGRQYLFVQHGSHSGLTVLWPAPEEAAQ